ncbi:response regulator transcription factor [Metabacillus hrfriensis]|uniref:Response regulator transcription factor n=1 Tax=Metabacillus hrfriensis TaxID=3048891 RepID=A0ACD4RGA7_9BACI|nr:response regulator transcription factor [Metabacillus sp. CT-WN-B3]UOK59222.1 response regulator transcription factor [Bacillus sp. OVS6]USK30120.1 response regulator transcription factor [Bacillus sp. CMF21]WHZ59364.1 response regulator transcription factor [Metabacillus sp. CT-WN-B3]
MWRVVIVDDDRHVLAGMRKAIPWETIGAVCVGEGTDGASGYDVIMKTRPDIVMTDIYMPVMTGLEMLQRLREHDFNGKAIILSGYADFEYARKALQLDVHDYLSKPVTIQTITEVLQGVITQLEKDSLAKKQQRETKDTLEYYQSMLLNSWLKSVVIGLQDQQFTLLNNEKLKVTNLKHIVLCIQMEKSPGLQSNPAWPKFIKSFNERKLSFPHFVNAEWIELDYHDSAIFLSFSDEIASETVICDTLKLAKLILEDVRQILTIPFQMGAGSIKDDWQHISISTKEALSALSKASPYEIVQYEKLINGEPDKKIDFHRPVPFYRELAEAFKIYHKEHGLKVIDQFVKECEENNRYLPSHLKLICKELWAVLTYSLYENGLNIDELSEGKRIYHCIDYITGLKPFSVWLKDALTAVCEHQKLNEKENIRHKQAVEYMMQYVQEHYSKNITLQDLSEQIYISRNYLSQIFKKATGLSFNHYVNKIRMEKAKNLILEGKLLIYEVAEEVGYKNTPYFSSLFKKYTGLNPTDLLKQ